MKKYALIVAGGSGSRMNSDIPKQFITLCNRPVLMHTIQRFYDYDPSIEIILVLPSEQFSLWEKLCEDYNFSIQHSLVAGGKVRYESVKNGLSVIENEGFIAIHDGVRPLVSMSTIYDCFKTAEEKGNAIPVMPVIESLRLVEGDNNKVVERSGYVTVQTPQVFKLSEIKKAYKTLYKDIFTDDASVMEYSGYTINLVEGNKENIKITHPLDLIVAELLLNKK